MSSGLDDLERRGRWGRNDPPPPPPLDPPARATTPSPTARTKPAQPRRRGPKPAPDATSRGVERVVIYLSPEQTAWIRARQIEALRAGKRVSASKLVRELMDRAMH